MSVLPIGIGAEEGGYQIERSLRFNSADSAYLSRTPASAGNRKTWTWSGWVKRTKLGVRQGFFSCQNGAGNASLQFGYMDDDGFQMGNGNVYVLRSSAVFRDPAAWQHWVISVDTTLASNRCKIYLNASQITTWSTDIFDSTFAQNADTAINQAVTHYFGQIGANLSYMDGYMAESHFIDGQALDPTSFGEYNSETGVWQPKAYTGSYGTNGFYLDFADNSSTTALGYDAAGSNDWTPNNFSVTAGAGNDSLVDTPTNYGTDTGVGGEVRGNYATINPLALGGGASATLLNNGNLQFGTTADGSNGDGNSVGFRSTIGVTSGKWYIEGTKINATNNQQGFGFGTPGIALGVWNGFSTNNLTNSTDQFIGFTVNSSEVFIKTGSSTATIVASSITTAQNTVYGIALDLDSDEMSFYVNGSQVGSTTSFTRPTGAIYFVTHSQAATWNYPGWAMNFGQRPFAYTAPSGFKALCTQNLPEPTVVDGGEYFNTVLYTGNGTSQSITGVGFAPDFVWIKNRSSALNHNLTDRVRDANGWRYLESNTTSAEGYNSQVVSALGSDGFSVGNASSTNGSGNALVAWNWKANGAGVSNTDGTITSTVSANTTAGFSIVTYGGTGTVGHGLGVAPVLIIAKSRATVQSWSTSGSFGPLSYGVNKLLLESTAALTADTNEITAANSTTFTTGGSTATSSASQVAYCFAPVEGYSAFGSYTGSGATDGSFIYTGFRPAFVMVKAYTPSGENWGIYDNKRDGYNIQNKLLYPNLSNAENAATNHIDLLSNGFKFRSGNNDLSGYSYIYAAFAENPFKYSLAR